jgi:hypothetical protein
MRVFARSGDSPVIRLAHSATLAVVAALAAGSASAIDIPPVKTGLWETTITRDGVAAKATAMKMCMNNAVQKEMMDAGMGTMKEMCSKNDVRREGNRMYGDSVCKFGESTVKSTSVTTFAADTRYRSEIKTSYAPPLNGRSSGTTVVDAKWTGPCPAGMQPGDVTLPDGRIINTRPAPGAPAPRKQ